MKKIFSVIFFAGIFVIKASAQIQRETDSTQNIVANSGKKVQQREMMKNLNLTKEQIGQLKEFHRSIKQKKDGIINDATLTEEQRKSKLKELHKEQKEKLNSVLTPEQKEKLREERKN